MANRILRDWTDSELKNRLIEIDAILKSMPKAEGELRTLQPKKWRLYCEKRRVRMAISSKSGFLTQKQLIEFASERGFSCEICGSKKSPSIDHVIPISKDGLSVKENLRVLCASCNSKKWCSYAE